MAGFQVVEMPNVSGRDWGLPRQRDAGDLRIAHIHGLALSLPARGEMSGSVSRRPVENRDAPGNIFVEQSRESGFQSRSTPTGR